LSAARTVRHADPLDAFRRAVSQEPGQFVKGFRQYLAELRPDGTAAPRTVPEK
jgi:hypothetical protein